ncbi:MAG: glycosyltransferase family 2 protein [Pseudomonadota bacterium]
MTVSVIVFEINEIDGMRAMMPKIKKEWYDELIVVDGGSNDGTIEYCHANGYPIFVQSEKGVGAALNEAVRKVRSDIIVIYAPDGSFEPDQIPLITEQIRQGVDVVNVSRYMNGTKSLDDNFFTATGNRIFTVLANLMFPYRFTDFLYTYLGFRRSLIEALGIDNKERTWGQILLLRAIKRGLRVVEIPGVEHARIGGDVKVPKIKAAWALVRTLARERLLDG